MDACGCDGAKINAVHLYLEEHFPDCPLSDVHAPKRLREAGLPEPTDCHHVVRLVKNGTAHYAVLTYRFLQLSAIEIWSDLNRWKLATALLSAAILILTETDVSAF